MINLYKANIVALQETKLWNNTKFTIPHYNEVQKDGYYNRGPHGGVTIYIHTSIPYNSVEITTPLQAVAVRVQLHVTVNICNIYSLGSQALNQQQLTDIYNQLPQPCIILGDFNAHNNLWGSNHTDSRGRLVEAFLGQHDINIMNNGALTRILYDTESSIDLTVCLPQLETDLHWTVLNSPGDSDHGPRLITYDEVTETNV